MVVSLVAKKEVLMVDLMVVRIMVDLMVERMG